MSENAVAERPSEASERPQLQAFVADEQTRQVLEQVLADLMIPQASTHRGNIRDAMKQLTAQRSPRLLVVDLSGSELPISDIDELAEVCEPGIVVIALGDRNDVAIFRDLIQHGVSDYLVKPVTPALLQRSILNAVQGSGPMRQTTRLGRLVAVTGVRGGVGGTMLATGCAHALATSRRRRIALVDLDLHFGSVALALDLDPTPSLRDALENPQRIDALFLERAMVKHSDNLFVLSAEEALGETVEGDRASLELLLSELRNRFHYVVLDLPRQVNAMSRQILEASSNLVIVTDLSLAGMRDTLRLLQFLPSINAACSVTVVANRVGEHKRGAIEQKEFEKGIGRGIDHVVPFDPSSVAQSLNAGRPVTEGKGPVANAVAAIAEHLAGGVKPIRQPFWRRLTRRG